MGAPCKTAGGGVEGGENALATATMKTIAKAARRSIADEVSSSATADQNQGSGEQGETGSNRLQVSETRLRGDRLPLVSRILVGASYEGVSQMQTPR